MRKPLLSMLFVMLLVTTVRAQDSTRLERISYVVGASLAFSLADYVGFNLVRESNGAPLWYRAVQVAVQTGISYLLYKKFGLPSTIAFNLIWWTWGDDLAYCGWAYLINPHSIPGVKWENRTTNPLLGPNTISWAGWTPIGLLRPAGSIIPRDVLVPQAFVGLSLAVALVW